MRNLTIAAIVLSGVLAACSDAPVDRATSPDLGAPSMARSSGIACSNTYSQTIKQAQASIFAAGTVLDSVQTLWNKVEADCFATNATKLARAQDAFMEYVRYTILVYANSPASIIPTDKSKAITDHWDAAFPYVTYTAPGLADNFLSVGAARVISPTELAAADSVEFGIPTLAAMLVKEQVTGGDPRGHLFVIYPESGNCVNQTALSQSATCFHFASFPTASPTFNPRLKVGICYEPTTENFVAPALGHFDGTTTTIVQPIQYPTIASNFCHDANTTRYGLLGRAARLASRIFGVQKAYAGHGGLGTLPPGISPFVPVDLNLFTASFTSLSAGTAPAVGTLPGSDRGYWTKVLSTSPGSILVQSSLADMTTKPVVLDQGGGNCGPNCGGLDLWGQIETADTSRAVSTGQYRITWTAVQTQPAPKGAPFVARGKDNLEIARVSYSKENTGSRLRYNGDLLPLASATWVKDHAQTFSLLVDFTTKQTTLTITNNPFGIPTTATFGPKAFVKTQPGNLTASDLSRFQAEFSGIDSGVIGWDNVVIERIPDGE